MKRKRIFAVLMAMVMLFGTMGTAYAKENQITWISLIINTPLMWVDGKEMDIDDSGTAPIIKNGRTLLPVRAVVEAMDGSVGWDAASQSVVLKRHGNEIKMKIGSTIAYLNGEVRTLDTAPVVINGRTMLPIRFIAENFNVEVTWDPEYQAIDLMAFPEGFVYEPTTPVQPEQLENSTQSVQGNAPAGFEEPSAWNNWKTPYNLSNTWLSDADIVPKEESVRWYMGNYQGISCYVAITMYTKSSVGDLYLSNVRDEFNHYPLQPNMPVSVQGITTDGKYYVVGSVWWGNYYIPVNQLTETPPANILPPADVKSKALGLDPYAADGTLYYGRDAIAFVPSNYWAEYLRSIGDPYAESYHYEDKVLDHYVYADKLLTERTREEVLKIWKMEIDQALKHNKSTQFKTQIACDYQDFTEAEFIDMSTEIKQYLREECGAPERGIISRRGIWSGDYWYLYIEYEIS